MSNPRKKQPLTTSNKRASSGSVKSKLRTNAPSRYFELKRLRRPKRKHQRKLQLVGELVAEAEVGGAVLLRSGRLHQHPNIFFRLRLSQSKRLLFPARRSSASAMKK